MAAKWVLRDIDASAEQQERVTTIVGSAIDDLFRLKEKHQVNGQAFAAQLGAASLDRAALEEIRRSEIALADEASKRLVQALADASEVLTPEQRQPPGRACPPAPRQRPLSDGRRGAPQTGLAAGAHCRRRA